VKVKSIAIPIRCVDFSESSQVVSFFTREQGIVDGIAKGAHRLKNSFQGPLDLAVLYEMVFVPPKSPGLAIVTEAAVLEGFRGLRSRLDRHVGASHVIEFLRCAGVAGEPETGLFDVALETLVALDAAGESDVGLTLARFDTLALTALGLLGPLDACVECGRSRPDGERPVFLSSRSRGILCRQCRAEQSIVRGVTIPGEAMRFWASLTGTAPRLGIEPVEGWNRFGARLRTAIALLRTNLLERELVLLQSSRAWTETLKSLS
jgi:DNA repair protein RecO (recombination protein O)